MVFQWKVNVFPVDAQIVGEVLTDIEHRTGKIDPKVVVEESRNEDAPLYPCFEWDNVKAAEKHRISQAQQIIRNIVVVNTLNNTEEAEPIRAFVSVRDDEPNSRKYISMDIAIQNSTYSEQVILNAKEDLERFRRKYSSISKFYNIIKVIDETLKEI